MNIILSLFLSFKKPFKIKTSLQIVDLTKNIILMSNEKYSVAQQDVN